MPELSIIIPCLNEAETLAAVIDKAHQGAQLARCAGYEIIVADNGSTDNSRAIAQQAGATCVEVPTRGYGAALQGGIQAAQGKYIIMGDADDSYDFSHILPFIIKLREGYQLVMGTRLKGEIEPGAMPFLHQYLGNPVLTFIGNLFFKVGLSDFHCGLRGFDRQSILDLNLRTLGMEFASEMVIRSALEKFSYYEIPITYYPDGRSRSPHLRTWQDGWRHLRFMLLYSPDWLFLYPGIILTLIGFIVASVLLLSPVRIGNVEFDVHTLLAGITMLIAGIHLILMSIFARIYASYIEILPRSRVFHEKFERLLRNTGLIIGVALIIIGIMLYSLSVVVWGRANFGSLNYQQMLRIVIPATSFLLVGFQLFFSSFLISLLNIKP